MRKDRSREFIEKSLVVREIIYLLFAGADINALVVVTGECGEPDYFDWGDSSVMTRDIAIALYDRWNEEDKGFENEAAMERKAALSRLMPAAEYLRLYGKESTSNED